MSENLKGKNAASCIAPRVIKIPGLVNRKCMIATLENIRERIKASVAKHSNNTLPLYYSCASKTLSLSEFQSLLQQMQSDGEIIINANGRVLPPVQPASQAKSDSSSDPIPDHLLESETQHLIHCLVNRSRQLKHPTDKRWCKGVYYDHANYKAEQIPVANICEETLLKGYHLVPGTFEFLDKITEKRDGKIIERRIQVNNSILVSEKKSTDRNGQMAEGETKTERIIKDSDAWQAQQLFLIEFDDTAENTLADFINTYPFIKQNAWLVTESIRSRYDDPRDDKCNGQLRPRIVFCMPHTVNTKDKRQWVYDALVKEMPDCDTGSANSITNGGLGKAGADFIKIGNIVNTDWFNRAIEIGKAAEQEKQAEHERSEQERKRKQAERAAMGFTEREGELPLEALAKADPSLFLESLGLSLKSESGQYHHWGRPEKQGDTALSVWQSDRGNWQIRVFANSIPTPPGISGAMPFTRFYCYHELNINIEGMQPDTPEWKDINAQLATHNYGTWLSDDEFHKKYHKPKRMSVKEIIEKAPSIEVREIPSFPHFSTEECAVVDDILGISPDAGWHGQTPIFTTKYEHLYRLTNKFKLNGQPSEVEKRRVWSTLFGNCELCGAVTAQWVDRYLLTAGLYCDGCHKDYHLGSYLELELARKLPNSIASEYQGFLGDDPEFSDLRLWDPGTLTHLGAAMSTGKSTEINKQMKELASQWLGKGIIAVPRVSLARFLAHYLRGKRGYRNWGLWHEGCNKSDRFIGNFGAIVCLPSLPRAIKCASDVGVERLYIAIDEIDFSYNLLSLSIEQATAIKKCLREAIASTGLVVSGQTESTLALEAFAEELECEQVQGFYNTAQLANGNVVMHKHPDTEGKSNIILCGVIDDISDALSAGHNIYAFCSTRRDGDLIADVFQNENPVIYNAYTKGSERADAVLCNQRLTDSHLFIGTSAAGIGISISDPKARTVVACGLVYGSRDASMSAQMCFRDRRRCGVSYHYTDYDLPLPVRPTENEEISIYHEVLKQTSASVHLPSAAIRKIAYAQALGALADVQIDRFISHHLGTVGNMPVYQASALNREPEHIDAISSRRTELKRTEREKRIKEAIQLVNQRDILTTSEIRKGSNNGTLLPDNRLAHETANAVAQAVGWDDKTNPFNADDSSKDFLNNDDLNVAIKLVEENISVNKLAKQRRGYLAVKFPKWTDHEFKTALEQSESALVNDGLGVEITSIHDDRFLGELLRTLLDRIKGKGFDSASLAETVREVLQSTTKSGKTFGSEIELGALGAAAYRKVRFLHCADDDRVLNWVRAFISEWYPARIEKRGFTFRLTYTKYRLAHGFISSMADAPAEYSRWHTDTFRPAVSTRGTSRSR